MACGFGTAYEALQKIGISGDDAVLVVGLGPVGLATLMLCKAMGAEKLIGAEMNDYRIKMAQDLGLVDYVFKPSDTTVDEIRKLTGGHGVERAIDCSASDAGRQTAVRATRDWGKVALVGEGNTMTLAPSPDMMHSQKTVYTVYSNNDENGRKAGNAYIEWLTEQGRSDEEIVAILVSGTKGNVAGVERRGGLMAGIIQGRTGCTDEEALAAAEAMEAQLQASGKAENADANFRIVGQGWGNWVIEEGLTATEDFITANPDVNVILGENDQMLFGSIKALENASLTGVALLAAADGACDAYDLIKENGTADNPYVATGLNSPVLVGRVGMDVANQIVVDGAAWDSFDKITETEAAAITVDNVDDYYDIGF